MHGTERTLLLFFLLLPLCGGGIAAQQAPADTLPLVRIDTFGARIPDDPKTTAWMEILRRGAPDGARTTFAGHVGIELRGTSSQFWPKKQYGLETRDEEGDGMDVPLLDLPAEEDWILNAPYADRSALRNALVYTLARDMGRYASRVRFCELEMNGLYQGVYVLLEKIKRDKHRVNIAKLSDDDNSGETLTGGYMLKFDNLDADEEGFTGAEDSLGSFLYIHVEPEGPDLTNAQRTYIREYVGDFERVMRSAAAHDEVMGYSRFIDVASFVDFLILNELSNNIDGYVKSTYLYKDRDSRGGKLAMGPVWDFNHSFGNAHERGGRYAEGWRIHRNRVPFWWKVLLADTAFVRRLEQRWFSLRAGLLSTARLEQWIDSAAAAIAPALERDHTLWRLHDTYVWMDAWESRGVAEETHFLKTWLRDRIDWIDTHIAGIADGHPAPERSALHMIDGVAPQPARGAITLAFTLGMYGHVTVTLCDLLGRERLRREAGVLGIGAQSLRIDTGTLSAGCYLLRLHVGPRVVDARTILISQ